MRPDRIVLVSEEDVLRAVKTKGRRSGGGGGSGGQLIILITTGPILHIYVTFMSVSLTALWLSSGHIYSCCGLCSKHVPGLMVHLQPAGGALRGASSH